MVCTPSPARLLDTLDVFLNNTRQCFFFFLAAQPHGALESTDILPVAAEADWDNGHLVRCGRTNKTFLSGCRAKQRTRRPLSQCPLTPKRTGTTDILSVADGRTRPFSRVLVRSNGRDVRCPSRTISNGRDVRRTIYEPWIRPVVQNFALRSERRGATRGSIQLSEHQPHSMQIDLEICGVVRK